MIGFLNIDKPAGMTSHDVVAIVRRETGVRKVGHAGTLDPIATGVLVLCVGQATRLSEYVMAHTKVYQAIIHLGVETDTYDADGSVIRTDDRPLELEQVLAVLPQYEGTIGQTPPMYSAVKQGGKKLYELARKGQTIERPQRQVTIHRLKMQTWDPPRLTVDITCSPGTYIRSLAHDIGQTLGVGGHVSELRRLASGDNFRVENAVALDRLRTAIERADWQQFLVSPDLALADMPRVDLTADQSRSVCNGGFVHLDIEGKGLVRAYDPQGQLVALIEHRSSSVWKPSKVLI